ncbi:2OG-Fe(II) oxygenase [Porticoccus sp.]
MALINRALITGQDDLFSLFSHPSPLRDFAVVSSFFTEQTAATLIQALGDISFSHYCVWSPSHSEHDLEKAFREPDPNYPHLTVHARPRQLNNEVFERVAKSLGSPDTLQWLSTISGRQIAYMDPRHVLTRWGPGSFLGPHLDAGSADDPVALVLSISLTQEWRREWGGETVFAWTDSNARVTSYPKLNQAVLFAPHSGSFHWVEPIAESAPDSMRHTWTLHYR